jgi:putative ABC transport system substrate-binding protein
MRICLRRREFIAALGGAVTAWPLAARAQQGERVRRVGFLGFGENSFSSDMLKVVRDELQKLGWTEGRNLRLDVRFGDGDVARTRAYAAELVKLAPDVIVTLSRIPTRAAQQETKTIPIVFVGTGDPVGDGVVKNAAHPEGNITGFANSFGALGSKRVELLKEAVPKITRVAHLVTTAGELFPADTGSLASSIEAAVSLFALQLVTINYLAGGRAAIESFAAEPNGGLVVDASLFSVAPFELVRLAEQYGLPAIYGTRSFTASGGLMSYDSDLSEIPHGVVTYVDRILRGTKVSELPVQYPTMFRLVVNLKAAKMIGLTIPSSFLLLRADEVIE